MKDLRLLNEIKNRLFPLKNRESMEPLLTSMKDKKVVMLGESTHGTSEFYEWRSLISKELVERHGFNFIVVEGDWPPCQKINEFIHSINGGPSFEILNQFSRWPTWMWANAEMVDALEWMKNTKVGFHGLDVYSFFESKEEVLRLLKEVDPYLAGRIKKSYACFESFEQDEKKYARSLFEVPEGCRQQVVSALEELLEYHLSHPDEYPFRIFDAVQNARIVRNAENYYRAMALGEGDSWNVRDEHMLETLDVLLNHYGPNSKGIVWAHNTHIGDYAATDMVLSEQVNIGGLAREKYGRDQVFLTGFGTHRGRVISSHAWDGPTEVLSVPPARPESFEDYFHRVSEITGIADYFLLLDEPSRESHLADYRGHRAIGVVYHPEWESRGNYVPTSLANRYDAFLYFDETSALTPLQVVFDPHKIPETYPFLRE